MYHKIYDFCRVKNVGGCHRNGLEPTPRVKFLMDLLKEEGIEFELDTFQSSGGWRKNDSGNNFFNIVMKGSSNRMVVAHHDIVNPNSDNANDNSCSVINCIAIKKLMPQMNVIILDGEESGGIGSKRAAERINKGDFGKIEWVLNLELSGKGGRYFFIGNYPGPLTNRIKQLFPDAPITQTPYNDSVTFRSNGIDSCVINPCPPVDPPPVEEVEYEEEDDEDYGQFNIFGRYSYIGGKQAPKQRKPRFRVPSFRDMVKYGDVELDFSIVYRCHSESDSLDKIDPDDMKEFVEDVCLKILGN